MSKTSSKKSKSSTKEAPASEYVIRRMREKILLNWNDWADAMLAKAMNETIATPEAKKQIAAAEHMMKEAEKRAWFISEQLELYKKNAKVTG